MAFQDPNQQQDLGKEWPILVGFQNPNQQQDSRFEDLSELQLHDQTV